MRTLTVSLTPHQAAMMQAAVETGGYASNSEIVRDALRLWEQREEVRQLELARLKQAYEEGMASGEGGVGSGWGRNDTLSRCFLGPEIFAGQ